MLGGHFFACCLYYPMRYSNGETRTNTELALHLDGAVHQLHESLHDWHTEAGTNHATVGGVFLAGKWFEKGGEEGLRHADTIVFEDGFVNNDII